MAEPARAMSIWAPLRIPAFRAMSIAVLVSNVGTWMQTVGAQWLLVHQAHAAILVALVQTADMLPDLLFGLVGGVLADIFDRRRLLMIVQLSLGGVAIALAILTFVGQMPPALLLMFTFVLGCSSVLSDPAYQSLAPELVPRHELRAASALGSISINLARVLGPALAGFLIAQLGVAAVFGLNALAYIFFGLVVATWRPPAGTAPMRPERFLSAVWAGGRYIRNAPVVRRILLRTGLFLVPASVLWSLLPVVATERLRLSGSGYGLLLGALGAGAIAGAFVLSRLHAGLSANTLMVTAGAVYTVALVLLITVSSPVAAVLVLLPAGAAWTALLSDINAALQLFLPAWVRARGLSVYQMVLFGAQAFGAVLWGAIADPFGVVPAFLIAAGSLLVGLATIKWWPLIDTSGMDRRTVVYWPEPELVLDAKPESGPVVVEVVYTIATEKEEAFLEAMTRLRLSRLRTGATEWGLYRDGESAHKFVELFVVPSWDEHLRQHRDRLTGTDRTFEEQATALSDPPPETSHLIAVEP